MACVQWAPGFVLGFVPVLLSWQSVCSAHSFQLRSLTGGFPCAFTQVKFSLLLVCRTWVTPASSPQHACSEGDLCEAVSLHLPPYPAFPWWLVPPRLILTFRIIVSPGTSNSFCQFSAGSTVLLPLCSLRSAVTSVG